MENDIFPLDDVEGYTISKVCPKELNENLSDETGWNIRMKSGKRDRLSKRTLRDEYQPVMVHYPVTEFFLSRQGKTVNLMALLPEDWVWDAVRPASPEVLAPELLTVFAMHQEINVDRRSLEVGIMHEKSKQDPDMGDLELNAKLLLWNVLLARCVTEGGYPANEEGWKLVTDAVLERRKQTLEAFDVRDGNPASIAAMPFAH